LTIEKLVPGFAVQFNTRSFAYHEGSKTPLRRGSNRNDRVACEENKTPSGRFRKSAGVEKDENIIAKSRKKREKHLIAFAFYDVAKKLKEIGKLAILNR
jgi:hypothetical protein